MRSQDTSSARLSRSCAHCSSTFFITRSALRKGKGKFCSVTCYGLSRRQPDSERFWSKIQKTPTCWLWTASLSRGYGQFVAIPGRSGRAHRYAWEMVAGPIPPGLDVLHTCDVRACNRNDDEGWYEVRGVLYPRRGHLWLGDAHANALDKGSKGRHYLQVDPSKVLNGEKCPTAKLNDEAIREIKRLYGDGILRSALARRFDVSWTLIDYIIRGKAWKHIA